MGLFTSSWLTDGTIFLLTIIIAAYFYMTRNFQYWKKRGVVEIPPVPFFGNFAKYCTLQMCPALLFKKFYEQGENLPYVGIYIFDKPYLVMRDPEIIKKVLIKDFHIFSDKFAHSSENDDISNNCLFSIDNPYWKYMRPKFTNLFTSTKLKSLFQNIQDVAKDLNNHMDSLELEGSGKKVDVRDLASKFTLDVIGLSAFGLKLNSLRDPDSKFRKFSKKLFGFDDFRRAVELTCVGLAPQLATFFDFRLFDKYSSQFFSKAFQEVFDERKTKKINRNDLTDLLIQLRDNDEISDDSHGFSCSRIEHTGLTWTTKNRKNSTSVINNDNKYCQSWSFTESRRRSKTLNSCKALDDLHQELQSMNYSISRSALYLRLLPKRSYTSDGKRHVKTVPVRLMRAQTALHKNQSDKYFCTASIRTEIVASILRPQQAISLSQDEKARVPLGITAANKQSPILMHLEYQVKLPVRNWVVAERHKLIPSVYALIIIEPNNMGSPTAVTF